MKERKPAPRRSHHTNLYNKPWTRPRDRITTNAPTWSRKRRTEKSMQKTISIHFRSAGRNSISKSTSFWLPLLFQQSRVALYADVEFGSRSARAMRGPDQHILLIQLTNHKTIYFNKTWTQSDKTDREAATLTTNHNKHQPRHALQR